MPSTPEPAMCGRKKAYLTMRAAEAAADELRTAGVFHAESYLCDCCGWWHVGKRKPWDR